MDAHSLGCAVAPPATRLRIYLGGAPDTGGTPASSPLQWLRALYRARPRHGEQTPLRLRIADAQGSQLLALNDSGPLTVVFPRAGTYHVDARLDNVRRRYTMALEEGGSFDLYLDLTPERL